MMLVCPHCHTAHSLEAGINDLAARRAVTSAFELTPVGSLLLAYVQLFKPGKQQLSMVRTAKLLNELIPMIKAAQIERHGRLWPAPAKYWESAIETMLASRDNLTLPIKSHGYLLEIIAGLANKAEGKQEMKSEQGRKYGPTDQLASTGNAIEKPAGPRAKKVRSEMPAEVRATIRKITGKPNPVESPDGN